MAFHEGFLEKITAVHWAAMGTVKVASKLDNIPSIGLDANSAYYTFFQDPAGPPYVPITTFQRALRGETSNAEADLRNFPQYGTGAAFATGWGVEQPRYWQAGDPPTIITYADRPVVGYQIHENNFQNGEFILNGQLLEQFADYYIDVTYSGTQPASGTASFRITANVYPISFEIYTATWSSLPFDIVSDLVSQLNTSSTIASASSPAAGTVRIRPLSAFETVGVVCRQESVTTPMVAARSYPATVSTVTDPGWIVGELLQPFTPPET